MDTTVKMNNLMLHNARKLAIKKNTRFSSYLKGETDLDITKLTGDHPLMF